MRFMRLAKLAVIGVALCGFQTGCGDSKPKTKPGTDSHAGHAHGAHEEGPHGGAIAELEYKDYHAELVLNHAEKKITVYVLDKDMKTPVTIKPEAGFDLNISKPSAALVELKAVEPKDGAASVFTGTNDLFANEPPFEGTFSVQLDGKPYQPKVKLEEHDDHDKKGGDEKKEEPKK